MFARNWSSVLAIACVCGGVHAAGADTPMRKAKPATLVSTTHEKYRITRDGKEIGYESIVRRVYDTNLVVFGMDTEMDMGPIKMAETLDLSLEEETYFPRSFQSRKTMIQKADTMQMNYKVDMYSNVAVLASDLKGHPASRRVVVPTGVPIVEVGNLVCWYEVMFWVEADGVARQRIQWLDPVLGNVESGEIRTADPETLTVLGKKTPVTVYKAERDRLGPATLYVDADKRIVRCEQNMMTYDLVEWSEE